MEFMLLVLGVFAFFALIGIIGAGLAPTPSLTKRMFDTKEGYENYMKHCKAKCSCYDEENFRLCSTMS